MSRPKSDRNSSFWIPPYIRLGHGTTHDRHTRTDEAYMMSLKKRGWLSCMGAPPQPAGRTSRDRRVSTSPDIM